MGLIKQQPSTEEITIDVVLSDLGRKILAENSGAFRIVKFAISDDEIDYSLFNPDGETDAAQDADILDTLIFEAPTNEDLALKYKLITYSDPTLTVLPKLTLQVSNISLKDTSEPQSCRVYQDLNTDNLSGLLEIPAELVDNSFQVEVDSTFLNLVKNNQRQTPYSRTVLGVDQYIFLKEDALTKKKGGQVDFFVQAVSISNYIWNTYGVGTVGSRTITTTIRIQGMNSGQIANLQITITES